MNRPARQHRGSLPYGGKSLSRQSSRAFTLVELMVVLVLIGILTAMIIPEMKGTLEEELLRSSSRQLIDVFSIASSRAVSLNQLHQVRFEPKTGRYQVERRVRQQGRDEFVSLKDVPGCEGRIDPRIAVEVRVASQPQTSESNDESPEQPGQSDEAQTLAFYPDGTADPGVIMLQDRSGFRVALRLNPVTARVQVAELERQ